MNKEKARDYFGKYFSYSDVRTMLSENHEQAVIECRKALHRLPSGLSSSEELELSERIQTLGSIHSLILENKGWEQIRDFGQRLWEVLVESLKDLMRKMKMSWRDNKKDDWRDRDDKWAREKSCRRNDDRDRRETRFDPERELRYLSSDVERSFDDMARYVRVMNQRGAEEIERSLKETEERNEKRFQALEKGLRESEEKRDRDTNSLRTSMSRIAGDVDSLHENVGNVNAKLDVIINALAPSVTHPVTTRPKRPRTNANSSNS